MVQRTVFVYEEINDEWADLQAIVLATSSQIWSAVTSKEPGHTCNGGERLKAQQRL